MNYYCDLHPHEMNQNHFNFLAFSLIKAHLIRFHQFCFIIHSFIYSFLLVITLHQYSINLTIITKSFDSLLY